MVYLKQDVLRRKPVLVFIFLQADVADTDCDFYL